MVQAGSSEDFIFTTETDYGDGGNFSTSKWRIGQNVRLTNPSFNNAYRYVRGNGMKPQKRVVGEKENTFDLVFNVDRFEFLKYISNISTETGSDPYTHTLNIPTANFNGSGTFAIQRSFSSTEAYLFKGCKPLSLNLSFQKGSDEAGFLTATLRCACQDIEAIAENDIVTEAESTRNLFHFYTTKLTTASNEFVEINSGSYNLDWNVNLQDSRYCNSTLNALIGEPIFTELTEELQLSVNSVNKDFIEEFLTRAELTGTNTLEFIYDSNNKVTFTFEHIYNEGNLPPTQYGEVIKTDVLYVPIISSIVVIDDIQNY